MWSVLVYKCTLFLKQPQFRIYFGRLSKLGLLSLDLDFRKAIQNCSSVENSTSMLDKTFNLQLFMVYLNICIRLMRMLDVLRPLGFEFFPHRGKEQLCRSLKRDFNQRNKSLSSNVSCYCSGTIVKSIDTFNFIHS